MPDYLQHNDKPRYLLNGLDFGFFAHKHAADLMTKQVTRASITTH